MVYVEILYKDLTRKRVPISDIDQLPKDNVLFISIQTDLREGKEKNISSCFGFDNYAIAQKRDNSDDWFMLFGWDEGDFVWRREREDCVNRVVVDALIGTMHVIFRGVQVPSEVWGKAKAIIDGEM